MIFFSMAYTPTREDLLVQATARVAIRSKLGLLWKEAAAAIGVRENYLKDALHGLRPLKFSHLYRITGFRKAFLLAEAEQLDCTVIENAVLRATGRKRMAKASLPERKEEVA